MTFDRPRPASRGDLEADHSIESDSIAGDGASTSHAQSENGACQSIAHQDHDPGLSQQLDGPTEPLRIIEGGHTKPGPWLEELSTGRGDAMTVPELEASASETVLGEVNAHGKDERRLESDSGEEQLNGAVPYMILAPGHMEVDRLAHAKETQTAADMDLASSKSSQNSQDNDVQVEGTEGDLATSTRDQVGSIGSEESASTPPGNIQESEVSFYAQDRAREGSTSSLPESGHSSNQEKNMLAARLASSPLRGDQWLRHAGMQSPLEHELLSQPVASQDDYAASPASVNSQEPDEIGTWASRRQQGESSTCASDRDQTPSAESGIASASRTGQGRTQRIGIQATNRQGDSSASGRYQTSPGGNSTASPETYSPRHGWERSNSRHAGVLPDTPGWKGLASKPILQSQSWSAAASEQGSDSRSSWDHR